MFNLLRRTKKNKKGFTLIEMVVVIAIIAILAAVFINRYGAFTENARGQEVMVEAKNIATAIDALQIENDGYTATKSEIVSRSGITGSQTNITELSTTSGAFTYTRTLNGHGTFTATRDSNGKIKLTH